MINKVRETVLAILNKNNYGYLSPIDFNLYAKQAQLDLFEDYFYNFNRVVNQQNQRLVGTEHADIGRQLEEVIDTFTQFKVLSLVGGSEQTFELPTDWYTFIEVVRSELCEGPPTTLTKHIAERVSEGNIFRLLRSNLTAPSIEFPAYVFAQQGRPVTVGPGTGTYGNLGNQITLYPAKASNGCVLTAELTYVRYPKDPNWTYSTLPNGIAVFNSSITEYQDFELPLSDMSDLIIKILKYAGVEIREPEVVQFALQEEKIDSETNT
jgi:hypothetical protein